MNITGKITGIKYKVYLSDELGKKELSKFDVNTASTASIIVDGKHSFAISKWVSPKRTRSYPYERVYNTLNAPKKITVIPIVKDEGARGDRDFIQWDTVSLMSLLDVFVIFAYYSNAEKKGDKITRQLFDNAYVISKIKDIKQYHSSALHWNLNELKNNLHNIINKTKTAYQRIEKITTVKLHGYKGLETFQAKLGKDVSLFMDFSRGKAEQAQSREFVTIQPKEKLSTLSKAKITITNYLGGQYFFTVDEIKINKTKVTLIEGKHTVNNVLPSLGDIKDGLLKMILYCNLTETFINGKKIKCESVLNLTSTKLKGTINSFASKIEKEKFYKKNNLTITQINLVERLFNEANYNNFEIRFQQVK